MTFIGVKEEVLEQEKLKLTRLEYSLTGKMVCQEVFEKLEEIIHQIVERKKTNGEIISSVNFDYSMVDMKVVVEIFCEISE